MLLFQSCYVAGYQSCYVAGYHHVIQCPLHEQVAKLPQLGDFKMLFKLA
jgi:hypothetical protein